MANLPTANHSALSNENRKDRPYEVLIVEDSADDLQLFLRALQKVQVDMDREITAISASSGAEAAERILHRKYDAIFLDINVSPPNGVELTGRIRNSEVNRTTTIVILTGAEDRGLMSRTFQAGANLFLTKPIDRMRLLRLIQVSSVPIDRERRRLQRVRVKCKVLFELGQDRIEGETIDVSMNGLLVRSRRLLPVGSTVKLSLTLRRGNEPISMPAQVVRVVENDCMALKLEAMGKAEGDRLSEFLVPLIAEIEKK